MNVKNVNLRGFQSRTRQETKFLPSLGKRTVFFVKYRDNATRRPKCARVKSCFWRGKNYRRHATRVKWVKKVWCRRWRIVKGWAEVSSGGTAGTALPIYRGNCPLASWTALFVAGTTWLEPRPTSKSSRTVFLYIFFFPTQRGMHISMLDMTNNEKRSTKII